MMSWILAAILVLHPEMVVREADLGALTAAIAAASSTRQDAADLVAVTWHETGKTFRLDLIGDSGHSVSPFQLWLCPGAFCLRAKTDLNFAAREALERLRASERRCWRLAPADRWAEYACGECVTSRESRVRRATAAWLLAHVEASEDGDDT